MNCFQFVNDLNWLTKLAVAPQPDMIDPQYWWDLESKLEELKHLIKTVNLKVPYLLMITNANIGIKICKNNKET